MSRLLSILILFFLTTCCALGQASDNQDTLQTVYFPIPGPGFDNSDCGKLIALEYGFAYQRIPGCGMVAGKRNLLAEKEFKKASQVMKKRHGKKWRENYENEVADCKNEKK